MYKSKDDKGKVRTFLGSLCGTAKDLIDSHALSPRSASLAAYANALSALNISPSVTLNAGLGVDGKPHSRFEVIVQNVIYSSGH